MIQKISTRDGYGKRLAEIENPYIVVLVADLADSCRVKGFAEKYPARFIQVGISEQDMFGIANGLGLEDKIPITNTFASFCLRGHEQIRLIAINNSNVKIVGHHSGISLGQDGASQMCEEDISLFRTMPNFTVIVPCDALETQKALNSIISINGPCYLRLSREPCAVLTNEYSDFEIGHANILRDGHDVLIVACGLLVQEALRAAKILEEQNISAAVMNMHTIKPLDKESLLKYAQKCKSVVTAEEHSIYGGLGSAVCEALSLSKIPIKTLGIRDEFGESGISNELFEKFGLIAENIAEYCQDVIKFKDKSPALKEVHEIVQDINGMRKTLEKENPEHESMRMAENKTAHDKDPRNRITKLTPEQKAQMDQVLNKMFGGRRK
ncbi:MAG: transketolase family protein [Candidatus Woesearchaeota archaeon]